MIPSESDQPRTVFRETASLCPVCLRRIPAQRVGREKGVYLEKTCPQHGAFATPIWCGPPDMGGWQRPKIPTQPPHCSQEAVRGCPFDCGLCPDHRQHSCTIILEVTRRCNLACPVCYADAGGLSGEDPPLAAVARWYGAAAKAGPGSNIQLSGGEPTLRDDLPRIVALGRAAGFDFIQLNTNGVRLAHEGEFVRELQSAGLASVFLQFDGTREEIYQKLRGRSLLAEKKAAILACGANRIGVVLVPTLVPGINDHDIGNILEFAVAHSPVVRAVHFQPVSYFGRYSGAPGDRERLTLPQLMTAIEDQSRGAFQAAHFKPPGCENSLCSFSASYLVMPDDSVRAVGPAGEAACCAKPVPAARGAARARAFVARQWAAPAGKTGRMGAAGEGAGGTCGTALDLDFFLKRSRNHLLGVSAMAFQDVWNLDLERVRDCCIHVMAPDSRLVPFCLYNLTSTAGKGLYRC